MRATTFLLIVASLLLMASTTRVKECGSGKAIEDNGQVLITNCDAPPCKLKKRTKITIQQKFIPNHDISSLKTNVHAVLLGVPLPFVGVDGTDACNKIFTADGRSAGCPLQKGVEYIYRNEFPILPIYPSVALTVHWALRENNKDITCFEVPSRII